jgi:hypothetical protein
MEKYQFIKAVNEDTIQKYIVHPSLRDVVFCAFNATPEEGQTKLNGVWINVAGKDTFPCGYDVIDIKDEDVDKWTFITKPQGKLNA